MLTSMQQETFSQEGKRKEGVSALFNYSYTMLDSF